MGSCNQADYDAIIVGAGFSGIRTLWELKQLGLRAKCFEAGTDVGGVWHWNRYPGARTDSEAWVYTMNFMPELKDEWSYGERYPSQEEVQLFLGRVTDRFDLRKNIQFGTRIKTAYYSDSNNIWSVTDADGVSTTCRYFIPATGPLSVAKKLPFAGLDSYAGEWYQASNWPKRKVDFRGKRIAVIGTGATGVQIIPKIAPVAKELVVFQRTPNFVLPGRNYVIDEYEADAIKTSYDAIWKIANSHSAGLAMQKSGKNAKDFSDAAHLHQLLDVGWESGGFHFQFETLEDITTDHESNQIASEYVRQKIRAIVKDQETAEKLCPKHPFGSKRPPCGHFYYEAYNRSNVRLIDISNDTIELYEKGIHVGSGLEQEFDMIIFALGYDAATGALSEMDVRGRQGKSLKDLWDKRLETYAGVLISGFPNMFTVCGPHIPFGNMPVVLDIEVKWIGKTLRFMEERRLVKIEVSQEAVDVWCDHVSDVFDGTLIGKSARASRAWFVGANIHGKAENVLFYFGGVPVWASWLEKESNSGWRSMTFSSA
ncbi:hypothetical protein NW759_010465 [Fusarium solani]|nr:hypothetical protein NW759_010465 [Fusarium solani]